MGNNAATLESGASRGIDTMFQPSWMKENRVGVSTVVNRLFRKEVGHE